MAIGRVIYFNREMDLQEAVIRAYMHPTWTGSKDVPRSRVIHYAIEHWEQSGDIDATQITDWYRAIDNRDRDEKLAGMQLHKPSVYVYAELYTSAQIIGQRIQDAGIKLKSLTSTSKEGGFNMRLIIALAMERLTRIIHEQHPDLQPEQQF